MPEIGRPYDPDRVELPEDQRAILCSISFGDGHPVRNPQLATNMHRVAWSTSDAHALNLAEQARRLGRAEGNPADGYTLTAHGAHLIGADEYPKEA